MRVCVCVVHCFNVFHCFMCVCVCVCVCEGVNGAVCVKVPPCFQCEGVLFQCVRNVHRFSLTMAHFLEDTPRRVP